MTAEDEFSLGGKVAIVSGGSSGIGAASVRRLAAAGARVVVGYNRGLDRAEKLIGELPGTGHCPMHLLLEDTTQIRRVAAAVGGQFGRADILVNSAGFTRMVPHADRFRYGQRNAERADQILLLAPFDQFRRYRHTGYKVALFAVERG